MSQSRPKSSIRTVPLMGAGFALLLVAVLTGFVLRPAPELSPRFNHVMLHVSDLEASIAFYTRAFDLEVTQRLESIQVTGPNGETTVAPVQMAFLKFPGQEFVLELAQQDASAGGTPPLYQHLGVDVLDIEAAAERALAAGARNYSGVRTVRASGGTVAQNAFFVGPDGELLELMLLLEGEF